MNFDRQLILVRSSLAIALLVALKCHLQTAGQDCSRSGTPSASEIRTCDSLPGRDCTFYGVPACQQYVRSLARTWDVTRLHAMADLLDWRTAVESSQL